ncbi:MAG: hypothetical protein DMG07_28755 [Acidobacteria bacterium]|nr:MAG: hypothetical protein DMG07_28755 [Acidobacteriota bacterium]
MRRLLLCAALVAAPQADLVVRDEKAATALKEKYLALGRRWAEESVLTAAERDAMERGRQWENLMTSGLDDPLARKVLEAGEPSLAALQRYYPGKVLDRTVLGTYSDPKSRLREPDNEFVVWWNGALSARLFEGRQRGGMRPIATNCNLLPRVGATAEMFGRDGERYSRIGYEDGYLPIIRAAYTSGGVRYEETVFAARPEGASDDVAYLRLSATNTGAEPLVAELHEDLILIDGTRATASQGKLLDAPGKILVAHSDPGASFDAVTQRLSHRLALGAGESRAVYLAVPYLPAARLDPVDRARFESEHARTRHFWIDLLGSGMKLDLPEARANDVWRALLLQNFVLADGPRFTYGAGLWYNSSYFPVENGIGTNDFAFYGFADYAQALLPFALDTSLYPEKAGRKYQNRRAVVLHHLYQNYRLTRKLDVFHRYARDLYRVAEEIIADRRKTMVADNGARPLHWGLLPPDRPGADDLGGSYTMYVVAHNITSCQGLQDLGNLLVQSGVDPERGRRYLEEARDYRKTIMDALSRSVIRTETRPLFVPLESLYFAQTPDYGPEPYDDLARGRVQGTYYHYWADMELGYNFFDPDDRLARWITDYLEKMGGFVLGCTRARNRPDSPYGWINNVYNSGYYNFMLRRGEIDRFLLGFYARLAFGMTQHAYVASEGSPFIGYNTALGGFVSADYSFPNSAANSETLRMLRAMLVQEELDHNVETGVVYLARGTPRAWLRDGARIAVTGAPSFFGRLSFSIESEAGRGAIRARITAPARDPYKAIVLALRHPAKARLQSVKVNGRAHRDFDPQSESIRLQSGPREFVVEALYR